ncbi:MAG: hypothetical protein Q9O74_02935 [Planctomycetota bacterium]|nr:hypothetical protein [Planctomycetota bacterium]
MNPRRIAAVPVLLSILAGAPVGFAQAEREPRLDFRAEEAAAYLEARAPTNAALVYYVHFMYAPQPMLNAYVHFNDDPDDDSTFGMTREEAERALRDAQDTLDNLAWASTLPECDFGIQYQQGWTALLPHLGKLRGFARVLDADARRHLALGEPDIAAERLATIYRMAKQTTGDHIIISSLVGAAMTNLAHKLTREMIEADDLTETGRDLMITALEGFGRDDPDDPFAVRQSIVMEGVMSLGWIATAFPEGRAGTKLAEFGLFDASADRKLVRQFNAMSGPELSAEAERIPEYYSKSLEVWDSPKAADRLLELEAVLEIGGFGKLTKAFASALSRSREQDILARARLEEMLELLEHYEPEASEDDALNPAPIPIPATGTPRDR